MKLYMFMVAPNPTRVRLYLAEKRAGGAEIPIEEELVNLREGEQKSDAHLARHPLGKLPVLELDDGSFLTESTAIIEYLEERYPDPPMLGRTPEERARARELERLADVGVLMPVARTVHATNSPLGLPPNPDVAESALESLPNALGVLDRVLAEGGPFLGGERPAVADCTLAAGLQFGRFFKVRLPTGFGHIERWDVAFRKRPTCEGILIN